MSSRRAANPFRYRFIEPAHPVSCIMKLWFGKRYYILKAKSATQAVTAISQELDRRLRLGCSEDHIYYHVVAYINRSRVAIFEVEVLFESENQLALLKREFEELRKAKNDEANSLNNYFEPYIAGWIKQDTIKKFEAWKKSLTKKPVKKNAKPKATKDTKAVSARRSSGTKGSVQTSVRGSAAVGRKKKDPSTV